MREAIIDDVTAICCVIGWNGDVAFCIKTRRAVVGFCYKTGILPYIIIEIVGFCNLTNMPRR